MMNIQYEIYLCWHLPTTACGAEGDYANIQESNCNYNYTKQS